MKRAICTGGIGLVIGLAVACALAATSHAATNGPARAAHVSRHNAPVELAATVGLDNSYSTRALIPIRVLAHNRTESTIAGTIEVPNEPGGTYQTSVTLPPGASRNATLFIPSARPNQLVAVAMSSGGRLVGATTIDARPYSAQTFTVAALTGSPLTHSLRLARPPAGETLNVHHLTPRTFYPVPQALDAFAVIAVSADTVRGLDQSQLEALDEYVRTGGGLLLVGDTGGRQMFQRMPADLRPGLVSGTRTVSGFAGLAAILPEQPRAAQPNASLEVSMVSHPRGDVIATQDGVPLVIAYDVGNGTVVYTAFNPASFAFDRWSAMPAVLGQILTRAEPTAASEGMSAQDWVDGAQSQSESVGSLYPPESFPYAGYIGSELDNVPAPALDWAMLLALLAGIYVLLLGPLNYLVVRKLRRPDALLISVPLTAILCTGATFGVAGAVKNHTVVVNTISMVTLGGNGGRQPVDLYMGVFAPVSGTYRVELPASSYPGLSASTSGGELNLGQAFRSRLAASASDGGWLPGVIDADDQTFEQGPRPAVEFPDMSTWEMRNAEVITNTDVSGQVISHLSLNGGGYISGWVRNNSSLTLQRPVIVAGQNYVRLPNLSPGASAEVRVKPYFDIFKGPGSFIWSTIFGQPAWSGPTGGFATPLTPSCGGASNQSGLACTTTVPASAWDTSIVWGSNGQEFLKERDFAARLRNVVNLLPEAQNTSAFGQVFLAAWNQASLVPLEVNGVAPRIRALNLVVQTLHIGVSAGQVAVKSGTYAPTLVGVNPAPANPQSSLFASCFGSACGPSDGSDDIDYGMGGSITVEFHVPDRIRFSRLTVSLNPGGPRKVNLNLWDWAARRWVVLRHAGDATTISTPARFVSSSGVVRISVVNRDPSNDMQITNLEGAIQISGQGSVG